MTNEIELLVKMSYHELVNYLLNKYGPAKYNYFYNEWCRSVNQKVSRMQEGLYCHHIDEDKAIRLSDIKHAQINPYEYQLAERLVYCNILEHLILHFKIFLEPKHKDANKDEILGIGGVFRYICPLINDYLSGYKYINETKKFAFEIIDDLFGKYIYILRWFFSEYNKEKEGSSHSLKVMLAKTTRRDMVQDVYNMLIVPEVSDQISIEDLTILEKGSKNGNRENSYELGRLYSIGRRVTIDLQKAFRYFLDAAEKNHLLSILEVAISYDEGLGVEQNIKQAIVYYKKAAKQKNLKAIKRLGRIYLYNLKKYDKAAYYLEKEIELGHLDDCFLLSEAYFKLNRADRAIMLNQGIIDIAKDNVHLHKLALTAYKNLDHIFISEKLESELALKWYTDQIEKGDKTAVYKMAQVYVKMRKNTHNIHKAIEWLELSYQQGDFNALIDLGDIYLNGKHEFKDNEKAKKYYELASQYELAEGYYRLASYYRSKLNGEKDLAKAREYVYKAKLLEINKKKPFLVK